MSNKTNEVRDALRRIIAKEGANCLRDAGRFRSLWMDYVPQSKEAKLILSAVQEGVGSTLLAAKDKDEEGQRQSIKRCEQQMVEAFITEEGSRYAVREIALALNIDVDRIMPTPAGAGAGDLQPRRGPGSASRQVQQEPVSASGRQEIYPGQERYPRQQRRKNEEFPAGNAFKETHVKKKSKFPRILLILLLLIVGAVAGIFLAGGNDSDVIPVVPPVDTQDEEQDVQEVITPVVLPTEDTEEPAEDDAEIPPVVEPEPEPEPEAMSYEIDTIASNVNNSLSMVMDSSNVVYYTDGGMVFNSKNEKVLDFSDAPRKAHLVYDPNSDSVYLALNDSNNYPIGSYEHSNGLPCIYDISRFYDSEETENLTPVLDMNSCPALANIERGIGGPGASGIGAPGSKMRQIGVLTNGALLIPNYNGSSTYMVNITDKTVTKTISMYSYVDPITLAMDDSIIQFEPESTVATVYEFSGTSTEIEFEEPLPAVPVYAAHGKIYCYDDSTGVRCYNLDGSVMTLISKEFIQVKDYQSINKTHIYGIAVGDEDHIAFYDDNLNCIRMIRPAP